MKTKEELNALKEEVENLSKKLAELTEEELAQVTGGVAPDLFSPMHVIEPAVHNMPKIDPPEVLECPALS